MTSFNMIIARFSKILQVLYKMLARLIELLQVLCKGWFTICHSLKQVIDEYFTSNMDDEKIVAN